MTTLIHAGLEELVSETQDEYREKNIELAGDLRRMLQYREQLRSRLAASRIMAHEDFTRGLEREYLKWLAREDKLERG